MTVRPGTPEEHAAYIAGLCVDCRTKKYSAGRPRCSDCHQDHLERQAQGLPR